MRRILAVSFVGVAVLLIALPASRAFQKKQPANPLKASWDREDSRYKVGETATFRIESKEDGEATYRLSEDGFKEIKKGKINLEKGKTTELTGTLKAPGFLQLTVQLGKSKTIAAAAFDPTSIEPTAKMPA